MTNYFCHFDVHLKTEDGVRQRVAVLFTLNIVINHRPASEELKRLFADAYAPDRVVFIGLCDARVSLRSLIDSEELDHVHLPFERDNIRLYTFDSNGRLVSEIPLDEPVDSKEEIAIRRQGMMAIFARHGGLMEASQSYHYVKPSGGHSVRFIRPGNIMRHGQEVAFIACWLLRSFSKYTPAILADTASITQIAYSAIAIANRLQICEKELVVQSFGSYGGITDLESLGIGHDSLVLISASTSGNLNKRLRQIGADPKNIITLFSSSGSVDSLCDLLRDDELNPYGIDSFKTYKREECPECAAGSLPITIAGDSFLPETPEPKLKLIKRVHQPKWQEKLLKAVGAKNVFRCYYPSTSGSGTDYPIFCDLSELCDESSYHQNFELPLSRILCLGVDVIIHLSDKASRLLAEKAIAKYSEHSTKPPAILVADDSLDEELKKLHESKGSSLSTAVIASCVAGGFALLSISRSLRNRADKIAYFVALAVPSSVDAWEQMRSNLELRNDGKGKNPVEIVWQASLPQLGFGQASSWKKEHVWLQEQNGKHQCDILENRLYLLDNVGASRKEGLSDNVFLPSFMGASLRINKNFAFYKKTTDLTQADVFLIASGILHDLRDPSHKDGIRQSMNSHVLLDPGNFDRYNDGIVQAAILRSAKTSELAYVTHGAASRSIAGLLERMIRMRNEPEGEALPEFLLALVTRRMSLNPTDLEMIVEELKRASKDCAYLSAFLPSLEKASES
jgi:hypothetical protein